MLQYTYYFITKIFLPLASDPLVSFELQARLNIIHAAGTHGVAGGNVSGCI